jgi:hypothetical protein
LYLLQVFVCGHTLSHSISHTVIDLIKHYSKDSKIVLLQDACCYHPDHKDIVDDFMEDMKDEKINMTTVANASSLYLNAREKVKKVNKKRTAAVVDAVDAANRFNSRSESNIVAAADAGDKFNNRSESNVVATASNSASTVVAALAPENEVKPKSPKHHAVHLSMKSTSSSTALFPDAGQIVASPAPESPTGRKASPGLNVAQAPPVEIPAAAISVSVAATKSVPTSAPAPAPAPAPSPTPAPASASAASTAAISVGLSTPGAETRERHHHRGHTPQSAVSLPPLQDHRRLHRPEPNTSAPYLGPSSGGQQRSPEFNINIEE